MLTGNDRALDLGLRVLVLFMLFGGIIGLNIGMGPMVLLFRDAFVVVPIYALVLVRAPVGAMIRSVPSGMLLAVAGLLAALALNLMVPVHSSLLMVIIGVRVWCFYIPFLLVGMYLAQRPAQLLSFLRFFMICGLVVCLVGIAQALLIRVIGYQFALSLFFGANAAAVSQNFAEFADAGGIYRVPGTFSFVTQYTFFLYTALTVAAILSRADPQPFSRGLAVFALFIAVVAAVFSGARGAIFYLPMMLAGYGLIGVLNFRFFLSLLLIIPLFSLAEAYLGFSLVDYFLYSVEVARDYQADNFFLGEIGRALDLSPWGMGIGTSTTAARHALDTMEFGNDNTFEPLIARAYAELGVAGLVSILFLMASVLFYSVLGIIRARRMRTLPFVGPIAVLLIMIVSQELKASMIDLDPLNVFFWIFLGVLFGLRPPVQPKRRTQRRMPTDWLATGRTVQR